jgi:arylesterase/paraoxonase
MRRARRIAIGFSAVFLVGVVALALRSLDAMGVFTDLAQVSCKDASAIRGVTGPEDIRYDAPSNSLFISATDWRRKLTSPSPGDGLYVYRPGQTEPPMKLKGPGADFHPLGISLFRAADGSLTLMAVNLPGRGKPAIDIFSVADAATDKIALHEQEYIQSDLLVAPNSIVAVDKGRFYATNDHTSATAFGLMLENYLMLPRANVVYFDGANFRVVADGLRFANGINKSADGEHIYVAETTGREIRTYTRNIFGGDLTPAGQLPIASGLDNISMGADGGMYVAGHPKLIDFLVYRDKPNKPSPSQIFAIATDATGIPQSAKLIYSGRGVGAASVGLPVRDRLLIGSVFESKILSCAW